MTFLFLSVQITLPSHPEAHEGLVEITMAQFPGQIGFQGSDLVFQSTPFPVVLHLTIRHRLSLPLAGQFLGHHGLHAHNSTAGQSNKTNAQHHPIPRFCYDRSQVGPIIRIFLNSPKSPTRLEQQET